MSTYLVHHGYCATAEAFAKSTGQSFTEELASIKNRQSEYVNSGITIMCFRWSISGIVLKQTAFIDSSKSVEYCDLGRELHCKSLDHCHT